MKNIKEKGLRYASAMKVGNKQTVSFIFVHLLTPYYPPIVVSYCFLFSKKEEENEKATFFIQQRKPTLSFCYPFVESRKRPLAWFQRKQARKDKRTHYPLFLLSRIGGLNDRIFIKYCFYWLLDFAFLLFYGHPHDIHFY